MRVKDLGNVAEKLFDRYLTERGYDWEVTSDVGKSNPDRLVIAPDGRRFVCEVKSFATQVLFRNATFTQPDQRFSQSRVFTRSQQEALQPIRDKIKESAKQLKRYKDDGLPLVTVLANPMNCPIPLNETSVMAAMYGDIEAVFSTGDPAESESTSSLRAGRNGKLRNDHAYISAVGILREQHHAQVWADQWFDENRASFENTLDLIAAYREAVINFEVPEGSDVSLSVIETVSTSAVPLPRDLLNGPLDLRHGPSPARDSLVPIPN